MKLLRIIAWLVFLFQGGAAAGKIEKTLRDYGVDENMQRAISGMTKSGLSHDTIMKNIQNHYPDRKPHEINEIVVASNVAMNTKQARGAKGKSKK
jgi:hypothetical protein